MKLTDGALNSWVYAFLDDVGSALTDLGSLEGIRKTLGSQTQHQRSHGALGCVEDPLELQVL